MPVYLALKRPVEDTVWRRYLCNSLENEEGGRMAGGGIYEGQSGLGHLPSWSTLEDEGWDTPRLPRLEPLSEPLLQSKLEMDTSASWESAFKHDVLVIFV